jgi:hypothetical protein
MYLSSASTCHVEAKREVKNETEFTVLQVLGLELTITVRVSGMGTSGGFLSGDIHSATSLLHIPTDKRGAWRESVIAG